MTTLREAAQQALEALEYYRSGEDYQPTPASEAITALRAALAEPEQRPLTDVTEAVTKTVIEVEKLLCGKIGRQWQPSCMSIQTLVDELAALVAEREREACAMVAEERTTAWTEYDYNSACMDCAKAIRARGEA